MSDCPILSQGKGWKGCRLAQGDGRQRQGRSGAVPGSPRPGPRVLSLAGRLCPQQDRLGAGPGPTARALGGRPLSPKQGDGAGTLLSWCQTPESNRAERASSAIDFFPYKMGAVCFLGQACVSVAMHRFTLSWETSGVVNQEKEKQMFPDNLMVFFG